MFMITGAIIFLFGFVIGYILALKLPSQIVQKTASKILSKQATIIDTTLIDLGDE